VKKLILLFVLLYSLGVFSQNIQYTITIKDIETLMPIENVTIFILKTKQSLITNANGNVSFVLNGASNIQFSNSDYEKLTLRWSTVKENDFVVYLKHLHNRLDEIIVSGELPYKTLESVVSNSKKRLITPHRLKVYVREFFKLDNIYSYYNDGLVNFQFNKARRKLNTILLVEQNRSYGLIDADVSSHLKGYNLNNIMENYCNLEYFSPLFISKTRKQYEFVTKRHPVNSNYYIMNVTPLQKTEKASDSFEITYDFEKKLIIEYNISIAPAQLLEMDDHKKPGSKNITKSRVNVRYRVDGLDYYVLSANEEIGYDLVLKDQTKNIEVRNSFITTNFSRQNFTYRDSDVFTEKSLFNKKNKILTNYWDISGFTATDEEKAIVNSLEFKF
jgi:hypothetical protein